MEENIKILQTKIKLLQDIKRCDKTILYNLKNKAGEIINILNSTRDKESTVERNIYILSKEQRQTLEDLLYSLKADNLTSQRTEQHVKDYVREKEIKQEILDGL